MKNLSVLNKENYHELLIKNGYELYFDGNASKVYKKGDLEKLERKEIEVVFYDREKDKETFEAYYFKFKGFKGGEAYKTWS